MADENLNNGALDSNKNSLGNRPKNRIILFVMIGLILILIVIFVAFFCCKVGAFEESRSLETDNLINYSGKKVLYINSYHSGYEWSDGILNGIESTFDGLDIDLEIFEMDTKRNPSEEFKKSSAVMAKNKIESFKPDVLIVSDDNAFKYVVQEYYRDTELPIVFCGLNWDASIYSAPYNNTAGMVEVALIPQMIGYVEQYADGDKIGYLAGESLTAHKEADYPEKIFGLELDQRYVTTFEEWKGAFKELQDENDIIYLHNNAGINNWDEKEAISFILANTRKPIGTIYEWMMPYSLIGLTVIPEEQGEWAANATLRILNGENVKDIGVVNNKKGNLMLNLDVAAKLDVVFTPSMLKNSKAVVSGSLINDGINSNSVVVGKVVQGGGLGNEAYYTI